MSQYIDEIHITSDGGIIKKMIKAGDGECPTKGQEVTVEYEGRLEDGTVFDRSLDHGEPLKIRIGEG
jgi:FKBP-type peptidyl-prolyl cis-trans isomerase